MNYNSFVIELIFVVVQDAVFGESLNRPKHQVLKNGLELSFYSGLKEVIIKEGDYLN